VFVLRHSTTRTPLGTVKTRMPAALANIAELA